MAHSRRGLGRAGLSRCRLSRAARFPLRPERSGPERAGQWGDISRGTSVINERIALFFLNSSGNGGMLRFRREVRMPSCKQALVDTRMRVARVAPRLRLSPRRWRESPAASEPCFSRTSCTRLRRSAKQREAGMRSHEPPLRFDPTFISPGQAKRSGFLTSVLSRIYLSNRP